MLERCTDLFFEKGNATKNVWFYQLNLDRNLGKTNALNEKDLADFLELQKGLLSIQIVPDLKHLLVKQLTVKRASSTSD